MMSSKQFRYFLFAAILAGILSTLLQGARFAAAHQATRAASALAAGDPVTAMRATETALSFYPWQEPAQYVQFAALKQMGMIGELAPTAGAMPRHHTPFEVSQTWHPDQTNLYQLSAEAAFRQGQHAAAAAASWSALWRTPYPPQTPAQVWRMAMNEGRQAWGGADPRIAAAAVEACALLDRDVTMKNPEIRRTTIHEIAESLRAAGAPQAAKAMEN